MNNPTIESKVDMCIVAKAKCCASIVYASVDKPEYWDAESKKELADLVIAGYEVSRLPADEVRMSKWGCKCNKQSTLPL